MIGAASGSVNRQFQLISTTTITNTGSQDYTVPAGALYLVFECYGGGGGGGGGNESVAGRQTSYKGGGGGGGASSFIHKYESELLEYEDIIRFNVGAGGTQGLVLQSGTTGGSSYPETHRNSGLSVKYTFSGPTAGGGGSGKSPTTFNTGAGSRGVASEANLYNIDGAVGSNNHASLGNGGAGGYVYFGTDLEDPEELFLGDLDQDFAVNGLNGVGGIALPFSIAATDGTQPGGGGGGGYNKAFAADASGGAGGAGKVIIRAYG